MKEQLYKNFMNKKAIVSLIIGAGTLLVSVFGAAYAYFSVNANNNATNTKTTGSLVSTGNISLTTNTSKLYLNLDGVLMNQSNVGKVYYATTNSSGTPITTPTSGNGIYNLATASVASGATQYDCDYTYEVTATVNKTISDGSDGDIKITFKGSSIGTPTNSITYTLKELTAGTKLLTGTFKRVTTGTNQTITVESSVTNTNGKQDDYAGNGYTITVMPRSGVTGFSCKPYKVPYVAKVGSSLASIMVTDNDLWQTGLEGDGYRFTGTNPDNFVCFGTTDKASCLANKNKYLYRAIGVFKDGSNVDHVKLIKYATLPNAQKWNSTNTDVNWENSTLFTGLNGTLFATNTEFDYMQNTAWTNKITNWTWSSANTLSYSTGGHRYADITSFNVYLHEMNRASKNITVGSWTNPQSKISLMYMSDYILSNKERLNISIYGNDAILKSGWIHLSHNIKLASTDEWTMSRAGLYQGTYYLAWNYHDQGRVNDMYIHTSPYSVRPVFYLNNAVKYGSGIGTLDNPILLQY